MAWIPFIDVSNKPITRYLELKILNRCLNCCGLDTSWYNTHSFRESRASDLAANGESEQIICGTCRWNTSDSICFNCLLLKTSVGPLRNELFSGVARSAVFWAFSPSNSLWEWGSSFISLSYYLLWLKLICYVCIYSSGFMPLLFYTIPMCWQTFCNVNLLIYT